MPVYYGRLSQMQPGAFPSILAIGDSWFWYPLPAGYNLLQTLADRVLKPVYANILSLGYIGAKLEQYTEGKYAPDFKAELGPFNAPYYSAIFISGAGNDVVDYSLALEENCTGIGDPDDCFNDARFDSLLAELSGQLGTMIRQIQWAFHDRPPERRPHVFVHCYDYAPPNGKGARIAGIPLPFGPWLKPAMDRALVRDDPVYRQAIVTRLITRVRDTFALHDDGRNVHLVDSRGCLDPAQDWDNELHPNTQGFRKLAEGPWRRTLQDSGFA